MLATSPFGGTIVFLKSATALVHEKLVLQFSAINPVSVGANAVGVTTGSSRALVHDAKLSLNTLGTVGAIRIDDTLSSNVALARATGVVIDARLTGKIAYKFADRQVLAIEAAIAFTGDAR